MKNADIFDSIIQPLASTGYGILHNRAKREFDTVTRFNDSHIMMIKVTPQESNFMINTYIYSFLWTMLPETEKYIDTN